MINNILVSFFCFILFISNFQSSYNVKDNKFTSLNTLIENNDLDNCYILLEKLGKLKLSKLETSKLQSYYGYYYRKTHDFDKSVKYYLNALKVLKENNIKSYRDEFNIFKGLALLNSEISDDKQCLFYLKKSLESALLLQDSLCISIAHNNLGVFFDKKNIGQTSILHYKKSIKYGYIDKALIYQNIGSSYITLNKLDSAKYYLNLSKKIPNNNYLPLIYLNLSRVEKKKEKFDNEIFFLLKAKKELRNSQILNENHLKVYNALYIWYQNKKDYKKALKYKTTYQNLRDSITKIELKKNINQLNIKYQTAEKDKQILETEAKRIKNRNFLIGSLLFILFAGTIGILSLKNSKRKRKFAEQEKELETQKNLTLLKEQELNTINAMVDGQEKERKRIAEDLHDNLGSVLATLKLHFENLQMNKEKKKINQEELFNKTENLIDEAYLKVRSIAHAKNAGVIANQGLLSAVEIMAEKISSADKINIDVIHFGLNKRLENSLEITVFRIIQELITNIIKHAEATNATINISAYDKNLNIIVEDNGKGFNIKKVNLKDGMGIGSIKTRIEHLKGTFEIDSTIGKGSSVIIDIPIE
ncbi:tetratricopeptide repeat-containing sensor histidine kinase [Polaribacter cellanae]|uniref:histidine kinase n=1 Tax=Polaribacter cellanae TaxID=2818493 RepID=A0A975CP17_9FLAO|nr:sensor histidine kinase [Polaribacter cellanae]QTE23073.1 sensor histidine kinase [Polaribacter cellanae]